MKRTTCSRAPLQLLTVGANYPVTEVGAEHRLLCAAARQLKKRPYFIYNGRYWEKRKRWLDGSTIQGRKQSGRSGPPGEVKFGFATAAIADFVNRIAR